MAERRLKVASPRGDVSALFDPPVKGDGTIALLAHGAGGSIDDPLLAGFAQGLAADGIGTLRFNFPYRERGSKGADPPHVLLETWESVFDSGKELGTPVWVGGKSLGGRIASMAVAKGMGAAGLIFIAYPLHPPGKSERIRDAHLYGIKIPMLFMQGTRDGFARLDLLEKVIGRLGKVATHHRIEGADHSFRVPGSKHAPEQMGRDLAAVAAAVIRKASA